MPEGFRVKGRLCVGLTSSVLSQFREQSAPSGYAGMPYWVRPPDVEYVRNEWEVWGYVPRYQGPQLDRDAAVEAAAEAFSHR